MFFHLTPYITSYKILWTLGRSAWRRSKRFCLFVFWFGTIFKETYVWTKCGKQRDGQMVDTLLGVYNLPVPLWFQMSGDIFLKIGTISQKSPRNGYPMSGKK